MILQMPVPKVLKDFFSTFKILLRQKEHRKVICKENPMAMLNSIFGKKDGYCHWECAFENMSGCWEYMQRFTHSTQTCPMHTLTRAHNKGGWVLSKNAGNLIFFRWNIWSKGSAVNAASRTQSQIFWKQILSEWNCLSFSSFHLCSSSRYKA